MAPFIDRDHFVQNIGDGTFFHSGSLAVRAAVAAGVEHHLQAAVQPAVAMTGGQRPAGGMTVPQIVGVLLAEGVDRIIVTTEDPSRYRRVTAARGVAGVGPRPARRGPAGARGHAGVTVLIHDQQCAAEKRRERKRGKIAQPADPGGHQRARSARAAATAGASATACRCSRSRPSSAARPAITSPPATSTTRCLDGDCPSFLTVVPAGRRRPPAAARSDRRRRARRARARTSTPDRFGMRHDGHRRHRHGHRQPGARHRGDARRLDVRGLDQTGLARRAAPVVSDLRISRAAADRAANKVGTGDVRPLPGLRPARGRRPDEPRRDRARTAPSPWSSTSRGARPGRWCPTRRGLPRPDRASASRSWTAVRDGSVLLDARRRPGAVRRRPVANLLLVGAAFQTGALPLPPDAIERAIQLNGVAVEKNLAAFRRGRQYVADPACAAGRGGPRQRPPRPERGESPLDRLIRTRVRRPDGVPGPRLRPPLPRRGRAGPRRGTGQDAGLDRADRGRRPLPLQAHGLQGRVRGRPAGPDRPSAPASTAEFGPGARASWRLHPPVLRALGMKRKIALGPWFVPAFRVLRAMRGCGARRSTRSAAPGSGSLERALIEEYRGLVDHADRPPEPGHRGAGRAAGRAARRRARLRGREDAHRRVLPPVHGRAPRPARRDPRDPSGCLTAGCQAASPPD